MSFWQTFWMNIGCGIAGYAAAVFTWDRIHTFIVGAEQKILALRDEARQLETNLRS